MNRPRPSSPRVWGRTAAVLAALAVGAVPLALLPRAAADASFDAVAGANAVDVSGRDSQDIPLIGVVEAGGSWGQAELTSNGRSAGYAAFPNPGASAAGAPALAGAPGDPLFIDCSNGQQPQDISQPGLHLHAEASDTTATGYAVAGQEGAASSRSQGHVQQAPDGTISAVATATTDGLVVAGTVAIHGLDATATATRDPSGKLITASHTAIASIDVGGQSFGFEDGTFTVAGTSAPVPAQTVLDALAAAGVAAHYQSPVKTDTGIVAGNFTLTYAVPATPQTAPVHVSVLLGEADASISFSLYGGSGGNGGSHHKVVVGGGGPSNSGGSSSGGTPPATGPAPAAPAGSAGAPAAPSFPGSTAAPSDSGPAPQVAGSPAPNSVPLALAAATHRIDSAWLYFSVVVAALAVFAAAQAVRLLGVRFLWTS